MCSLGANIHAETLTVVLDRLSVIDRLNVISSGSVVMKIDARSNSSYLVFQDGRLAAIFLKSDWAENLVET
jgi:hypothetical protein